MFYVFALNADKSRLLETPRIALSAEAAKQAARSFALMQGIEIDPRRGILPIRRVIVETVEVRDAAELARRYPHYSKAMRAFAHELTQVSRGKPKISAQKAALREHVNKLIRVVPAKIESPTITAREIEKRLVEELEKLDAEMHKPINRPIRNAPTRREPINGETFACDTCGHISEHCARTITAYHKGYHTYFCTDCHIEHWSNQPGN